MWFIGELFFSECPNLSSYVFYIFILYLSYLSNQWLTYILCGQWALYQNILTYNWFACGIPGVAFTSIAGHSILAFGLIGVVWSPTVPLTVPCLSVQKVKIFQIPVGHFMSVPFPKMFVIKTKETAPRLKTDLVEPNYSETARNTFYQQSETVYSVTQC